MGTDGDREGKANLHAGTVVFEFLILKISEFGKVPNVVVHGIHFGITETEKGAVHVDVFATGEFRVKTDAEFDKRN